MRVVEYRISSNKKRLPSNKPPPPKKRPGQKYQTSPPPPHPLEWAPPSRPLLLSLMVGLQEKTLDLILE